MPTVSVVIPVHNDAERLEQCLDALAGQTFRDFEVVVGDDGSLEPVQVRPRDGLDVQVVRIEHTSSYAARNAAVAATRGRILAFTDADVVPTPRWLERAVQSLDDVERATVVAGRIDMTVSAHPSGAELFDLLHGLRQEEFVTTLNFAATANLVVPRPVWDDVGGFDPSLQSGGDREWGNRAVAAGVHLAYTPDVVVQHPARRTLRQLLALASRTRGGIAELRRRGCVGGRDELSRMVLGIAPPVRTLVRLGSREEFQSWFARLRYLAVRTVIHAWHVVLAVRGGHVTW